MTIKKTQHLLGLLMAITMFFSCLVITAEARASDYIANYSSYMVADGSGKVSVWFDITGTSKMDEIGALTITIYEVNGSTETAVKTYQWNQNTGMLGTSKNLHTGSVTYSGTKGTTYYASVYLYAGKGDGGDYRRLTTASIVAK